MRRGPKGELSSELGKSLGRADAAVRCTRRTTPLESLIASVSLSFPLSRSWNRRGSMATVYEQLYTNATVLVTDFIKSTQQNDVANLYAGVDPTRLNWLEQAWMQWYQYIGNTTVATGIMSFVLHEVSERPLPLCASIEPPLFSLCAC